MIPPIRKRLRRLRRGFKNLNRAVRYALLIPALDLLRRLLGWLPHGVVLGLGRVLGRLAGWLAPGLRSTAREQLLAAGVADNRREADRLALEVIENLGMNALEWLHSIRWPLQCFTQQVDIEGLEHVRDALARGKGIIFVTAHMGNWELLLRAIKAQTGQAIAALMTPLSSAPLTRWINRMREVGGNPIIPNDGAMLAIVRRLRRGGAIGMLVDQDSRRWRGIYVDFFGRPAYTPTGPARLAQRSGAVIVSGVITRQSESPRRHLIRIDPPIQADPHGEPEAEVVRLTQAYTQALERQIRRSPAQWAWIHRRWQHQPDRPIRRLHSGIDP
jgi:KDO2-lipid IV(A) lauroyltransferase